MQTVMTAVAMLSTAKCMQTRKSYSVFDEIYMNLLTYLNRPDQKLLLSGRMYRVHVKSVQYIPIGYLPKVCTF